MHQSLFVVSVLCIVVILSLMFLECTRKGFFRSSPQRIYPSECSRVLGMGGVAAHAGGWPVRAVLCASVFAELASGFTPPVGIQARVCVDLSRGGGRMRSWLMLSGRRACVSGASIQPNGTHARCVSAVMS